MKDYLKEDSDKAIKNGNEFKGYLGVSSKDLSKEQLIMVCNVLFDALIREQKRMYLIEKYAL